MKKYKSKFSGKSIDYAVEAVINTVGKETSNPSLDYYDNSQSGLTATTLQEAVDEISSKIDSSTISSSAENVTYDNSTSGLTSNNVQGAIDELGANLGELGVISHTQNWDTQNWTYTITDVVRGIIPSDFINRWEFIKNDFFCRDIGFDKVSGYFYLNDITDLSYKDAVRILNTLSYEKSFRKRYSRLNTSNTFRAILNNLYLSEFDYTNMDCASAFVSNTYIENIYIRSDGNSNTSTESMFSNCYRLKSLLGTFRMGTTTSCNNMFSNCYSLQNVELFDLGIDISFAQSSKLTLASVVFIVKNCKRAKNPALTTTLTIHLHEQAYNRAFDDETEYTWNGQTYYGILELAEAVGISIVYP